MAVTTPIAKASSNSPPSESERRPAPRLLLILVLLSYAVVGLHSAYFGFSTLSWDDSEYVKEALDTVDSLADNGLVSWPVYIALHQNYTKPPLYVNSLALFIELLGRSKPMLAIGALAAVTSALLGWLVFRFLRELTSYRFAILGMLAIAGLPGVARWAPVGYPDLQLAVCVLWSIAILCGTPRARWLGLALGLGMLAKVSFPAFVILPVLYWWFQGDGSRARTQTLFRALMLAAVVAGIWYVPNLVDAAGHIGLFYVNAQRPNATTAGNFVEWLRVVAFESLSWPLVAAIAIGVGYFFARRTHDTMSLYPRRVVTFLLLGSIPALAISLPSPSTSSRYWIPAFVLLTLALLLSIYWLASNLGRGKLLIAMVAAGVLAQWALTLAIQIPWTGDRLRAASFGPALSTLSPGLYYLQPESFEAVDQVMDRVQAYGSDAPKKWYLSGNDNWISVPRLQVAAKVRRLPVEFDWADYFAWSEEETLARIREIEREPAILVVSEPVYRDAISRFFVQRSNLLRSHLGEFRLLETTPQVAFYTTQVNGALKARVKPARMEFTGQLEVLDAQSSEHALTLRVKLERALPCSYKVLIHSTPDDQPLRIWDQKPDPPFCQWKPGEERTLTFPLPLAYAHDKDRLVVGFFDESDAAHQWPPLKMTGGGNAICLAPGATARACFSGGG